MLEFWLVWGKPPPSFRMFTRSGKLLSPSGIETGSRGFYKSLCPAQPTSPGGRGFGVHLPRGPDTPEPLLRGCLPTRDVCGRHRTNPAGPQVRGSYRRVDAGGLLLPTAPSTVPQRALYPPPPGKEATQQPCSALPHSGERVLPESPCAQASCWPSRLAGLQSPGSDLGCVRENLSDRDTAPPGSHPACTESLGVRVCLRAMEPSDTCSGEMASDKVSDRRGTERQDVPSPAQQLPALVSDKKLTLTEFPNLSARSRGRGQAVEMPHAHPSPLLGHTHTPVTLPMALLGTHAPRHKHRHACAGTR